jgi:alpha-galactosidase
MKYALVLALALANSAFCADSPILTPPPGPAPHLNGPKVYGARPGHPFLYRIPATGERPMKFEAHALPSTLKLDSATGIISGTTPAKAGEYAVTLEAKNARGKSKRPFKIVVGKTLSLTPSMGWNDWYTHYERISDAKVRQAADAMIASGMADYGYQYVNIDDCWMMKPGSTDPALSGAQRDANGAVRPNGRFPDMPALTAYIHAKGLKAGIYTSPGPLTCGGYVGAYQHEEIDARQFAAWGFDFLKYDWCSYGKVDKTPTLEARKKPYILMGGILERLDRDMLLNLCQYGMSDVWTWGAEVGGQSWRTTGDLGLEKDSKLPGIYSIALKNAQHSEYAKPGAWNDPDYILIGQVGNAFKIEEAAKPTTLTADEQYSYMSAWALMASPLFFSGDMATLDPFTLNVLCNSEVIDVDQDVLGKQARIVRQSADELVLAKPLEDGSIAVGLFNLGEAERSLTVTYKDLGVKSAKVRTRDLWRQKDLAVTADAYTTPVNRHGVALIRVIP